MATESPKMLVYYIPVSSNTVRVVYFLCNITNTITQKAENKTHTGLCFGQNFALVAGGISRPSFSVDGGDNSGEENGE